MKNAPIGLDLKDFTAYNVVVDYSRSFVVMVEAGGYDSIHADITADRFPVSGEGKHEVSIVLLHFNRTIASDDAIAEMDKQDYRPGTIEELLALGEAHPGLQRDYPIAALGSFWQHPNGNRGVLCLWSDADRRLLRFNWFERGWRNNCRFLAVRK